MRLTKLAPAACVAATLMAGTVSAAPLGLSGSHAVTQHAKGVIAVSRLMPYEIELQPERNATPLPTAPIARQPAARSSAQQDNARARQRQRLAALGTQPTRQMDPRFLPRDVTVDASFKPGTIVIDTSERFLYHVTAPGEARRYGVGVGRPGFEWSGSHRISMKREWPGWTPPPQMRRREPDLPAYMPGGPDNPLGARALYLGSTLYRIHGSNAPWTIGQNVSSGCIRMRNQDVIELYDNVKVGTLVTVRR